MVVLAALLSTRSASADRSGGLNDAIALYTLGEYEESITRLEPFATAGNSTAQLILGKAYLRDYIRPHSCEKAKYWLTRSAEAGLAEGAFLLADVLNSARCGPPEKWRSVRWYLKADSLGHADAANEIG